MSKELKKQESNLPAMTMADWGQPQVSSSDIIIPKILCMQGLSELVTDDKAKMGDLVDSLTNEVIGNCNDGIEIIPFHMEKILIVSKHNGSDYEFDHIEPSTPENERLPYEQETPEGKFKNEHCMNFYCLRPNDMSLPYIVSFKGMSRKSGKVLATQMFVKNATAGKVPPAFVMKLTGTKTKNDKGTFMVLNTAPVRESSNEEISVAFNWYKTVNQGGVKVHEDTRGEAEFTSDDIPF